MDVLHCICLWSWQIAINKTSFLSGVAEAEPLYVSVWVHVCYDVFQRALASERTVLPLILSPLLPAAEALGAGERRTF